MARQSGPALLERPAGNAAPVTAAPSRVGAPADVRAAAPETPSQDTAEPAARRTVRRPPGRRGPLWLAALVVGAVLAAVPAFTGGAPTPVSVSAADYGLGAADVGLAGDVEDAEARRGISQAEAQQRLSELAASRAAREPQTVLPAQGRMTTCFCMRWGSMHYGIDLAGPLGTPVYAAADGVVLRAGPASGYGNAVYVQDADGNVHVYGHMRYYDVEAGDIVHAGDQIAKIGNEGQSTGPHLHYQINRGSMTGRPIDPEEWLADHGVAI
ncbi:murein DD-endopeptidase MepM/ murein hydrolase activator NlpD [Geodermatophilus bullaregiensis]|uniref:M23 family metallopeptidase n=1 Tax=Geodermatophilus bullaregiensis TaxID=1564160 RepID=UPI0027DAE1A1|nr:peptidoglycan DD-metalloendopeptidase family protein [Geodermatophilus bullaregiensis]MBM7805897.1 murein DD-endopeptidase MepM/ murein hydrolase activator NlpD [Geodermatophilus bullaregiensis]